MMIRVTPPPPFAAVRGNDWRSIRPAAPDTLRPVMGVSVVIPYYEAPDALARTLAALERQDYPRHLVEVVVVDDGSTPPLSAPATTLDLRVEYQEDLGFRAATARNTGARAARGDILLFLDCDMVPEAWWITSHARWHHAARDVLSLGFRAHVDMDDIDPASLRDQAGPLADLFKGRTSTRPEWIEFHMVRTEELTSGSHDIFRVVTSGNLGVGRWFFDEVGGFDESFNRWGMEDTEFGYRAYARGAVLVPERAAFCWHQGEGSAPSAKEKASLELQRAKTSHLIPHPEFRRAVPGRSYTVPTYVVTVDPLDCSVQAVLSTVEVLVANTVTDLVVWVDDRPDDPANGWLRDQLEPDPRIFFGPVEEALSRFPAAPFHVRIPAGFEWDRRLIQRLRDHLGPSESAIGHVDGHASVSITRSWLLHRAIRSGRDLADPAATSKLDDAVLFPKGGAAPVRSSRHSRSRVGRVLRAVSRARSPREAWMVGRWVVTAVWSRTRRAIRSTRQGLEARSRQSRTIRGTPPAKAPYSLGVEIVVAGDRSTAVFNASDRIRHSLGAGEADLVLADNVDPATAQGLGDRHTVVSLAHADPLTSVPAFDPENVNPIGWRRDAGKRIGALGLPELLPGVRVDQVVDAKRRENFSWLHHLEDVAAFHTGPVNRAGTLAALAGSGLLVHLNDHDAELEACLGNEIYDIMGDDRIVGADPYLRERLSIDLRRAALRTHSLRARARQVAGLAGITNHAGIPEVSIILPTKRPGMVRRSLEAVAGQTYPRLELVLILHGDGFPAEIDTSAVPFHVEVLRVRSETVFGRALNQATDVVGGKLVTKMDDDDHYGSEHVWDLVLAHEYSRANLVAKAAEFVYLQARDQTLHRLTGGGEYPTETPTIAGGALLISAHDLVEAGGWRRLPTGVDQALLKDVKGMGGRPFRTHGHGYVLVRHGTHHAWGAPDDYFLGQARAIRAGLDLAFAGIE